LERIFKAIDLDGDGTLSKEEILQCYEEHFGVPITKKEVDALFAKIDLDNNGSIDYTEFVTATMEESKLVTEKRLRIAFNMFDRNGDGSLSSDEIKDILCSNGEINPEDIDKIVKDADENGDGEIDFEEFCHMMRVLTDMTK